MAIKLRQAVFCEEVDVRPGGLAIPLRTREAISHGTVVGMFLHMRFRGSAGQYQIVISWRTPGVDGRHRESTVVELDGRQECPVTVPFECPVPGSYEFAVSVVDPTSSAGSRLLGTPVLPVRPQ